MSWRKTPEQIHNQQLVAELMAQERMTNLVDPRQNAALRQDNERILNAFQAASHLIVELNDLLEKEYQDGQFSEDVSRVLEQINQAVKVLG